MSKSGKLFSVMSVVIFLVIGCLTTPVLSDGSSPADGYTIHVQAPHMMADGTLGGPFHHYCKGISDEVLQCLLFKTTDPKTDALSIELRAQKKTLFTYFYGPVNHQS